jgi:hypothetical protein
MNAPRKTPFMNVADRLTDGRVEEQSRHSRRRAAAAGRLTHLAIFPKPLLTIP